MSIIMVNIKKFSVSDRAKSGIGVAPCTTYIYILVDITNYLDHEHSAP